MTDPGSTSSTLGSLAVCWNSASAAIRRPGAMAPPTYSAFSVITSYVVAVPMSTTMDGPPNFACAATALAMRSAPTSRGFSVRMEIPVRTPGSTTTGSKWK